MSRFGVCTTLCDDERCLLPEDQDNSTISSSGGDIAGEGEELINAEGQRAIEEVEGSGGAMEEVEGSGANDPRYTDQQVRHGWGGEGGRGGGRVWH